MLTVIESISFNVFKRNSTPGTVHVNLCNKSDDVSIAYLYQPFASNPVPYFVGLTPSYSQGNEELVS